jgi:small-conductance mechanosensitive channel
MRVMFVVVLVIVYFVVLNYTTRKIASMGASKSVDIYRIKYISKTLNIGSTVVFLILLLFSLGIEFSQVSIFLSSVFAVIGVAFFAQWSILSNITASLIIFFAFPYRVGDAVRVVDKDDNISGVIEEITLFHVIIKRGDDFITYPNSIILQKAVIKLADGSMVQSTSQAESVATSGE